MSARAAVVWASIATAAACGRDPQTPYVIAGPTVPSTVPTAAPYVWDSREELGEWVANQVTRGAVSLDGTGAEAVIRISPPDEHWVLRGPDLSPPAPGVRSARLRYRWRLELPPRPGDQSRITATMYFDTPTAIPSWMLGQARQTVTLQPGDQFLDVSIGLSDTVPALDVRYVYLASAIGSRGVLEIDRIELGR